MELKSIELKDFFELPNPGLTAYLDHVAKGSSEIIKTPFYGDSDITSILNRWESVARDELEANYPGLWEFEKELRNKVGPLSVQKPLDERLTDIESYYDAIKVDSINISNDAVVALLDKFQAIRGLRMKSTINTLNKMRLSTNSGSPYFTKRRKVLSATKNGVVTLEWQYMEDEGYLLCAVIGWRGQEGGLSVDEVKQRVIWMMPFLVNIHELQVYQVIIEACQRTNLVPAWVSMDGVDRSITNLFDTKGNDVIVCTDFEKFDQHFNDSMADCAKKVIAGLFTPGNVDSWLTDIFPIKYNIPIIISPDKGYFGHHGMASGSGGTNVDETLTHSCLQLECAQSNGAVLNPYSCCLGDDGILSFPGISIDKVIKSYTQHGQLMNETKQSISRTECSYLRRWHSESYRIKGICAGVYSTFRALGRLKFQERWYDPDLWGPKMVALRQLSIIENCKYHPLREKFAEFCMKGDKYRLGLDIPGFLSNIRREAKIATDNMPDFIGYTKSQMYHQEGIDSWWIVQYLKSKI